MSRRILVVDDEDDMREATRLSLEIIAGWEVLTAASGEEALRSAAAARPDAVLLDFRMPGMDGPATLQALRDDPATRPIPVIMLTAVSHPDELQRLRDAGADGVIAKPFEPMELHLRIARTLGWEA
jgi:CheY-like chemotaxis protein